MKMQIELARVRPNALRDFALYPIDENQVESLRRSIKDLGFFSGVTARLTSDGNYELACGHHRVEAARREGLVTVEAHVEAYDDADMFSIMGRENTTQRGNNAAAHADTVAAAAKLLAPIVLTYDTMPDSSDPLGAKMLALASVNSQESLDTLRGTIAKGGPGIDSIYRAINGFDLSEASKDTAEAREILKSENTKRGDIATALASLKASGVMGKIVADALVKANANRAATAAAAEAAQARATAEAEARNRAEAEALQVRITKAEAEAARAAEAEAEAKRQVHAANVKVTDRTKSGADAIKISEAKAEAAVLIDAAADATTLRKTWDAEVTSLKDAAAAADVADADAKAKAAADQAAARKDREALEAKVKAQAELAAVYDIRCVHVFRLTSHEAAFRKALLTTDGMRYIAKDQQLDFAHHIRGQVDEREKEWRTDAGAILIGTLVREGIAEAVRNQKEVDEAERLRIEESNARLKVDKHWTNIRRGLQQIDTGLRAVNAAQKSWLYDTPFPMDFDTLDRLIELSQRFTALRQALLKAK